MFKASSNAPKGTTPRYKSLAQVEASAPHWKDALRSDCIARARQKRRELVMQKRRQPGMTCPSSLPIQPVRSLIEEELRKRGIRVVSVDPGLEQREQEISSLQPVDGREGEAGHHRGGEKMTEMEVDTTTDEYAITEELLNSLLEDIEEELRYDGKASESAMFF
jgi:hypothetical protein